MHHDQPPDPGPVEDAGLTTWLVTSCSLAELATLRERMAVHERRLQHLAPAVRNEAIVEALLSDATHNPILAGALHRLQHRGVKRRQDRAALN